MGADPLEPFPEDWSRALGVVAHPDDMEYGAASAVARWTDQGKDVRYLLVTRGEAGISTMPPAEVGPLREEEERRSARAVGVSVVEFLDHADGLVEADLRLRHALSEAIRRHQPEVILSINHRDSWAGRVGTTPTIALSDGHCSMQCAMRPTPGSSRMPARPGVVFGWLRSMPRLWPRTPST